MTSFLKWADRVAVIIGWTGVAIIGFGWGNLGAVLVCVAFGWLAPNILGFTGWRN